MAYNRRKRKVKKNIPEAQAHIHATYNNTVVSITDVNGNVLNGVNITMSITGMEEFNLTTDNMVSIHIHGLQQQLVHIL